MQPAISTRRTRTAQRIVYQRPMPSIKIVGTLSVWLLIGKSLDEDGSAD